MKDKINTTLVMVIMVVMLFLTILFTTKMIEGMRSSGTIPVDFRDTMEQDTNIKGIIVTDTGLHVIYKDTLD